MNPHTVKYLQYLANLLISKNIYYVMTLILAHYAFLKVQLLMKLQYKILSMPDKFLKELICKYYNKYHIQAESCALGAVEFMTNSEPMWVNICSLTSSKKYKIWLIPFNNCKMNDIYLSETMLFNIEKLLSTKNTNSFFITPASHDCERWAEEAKISLISHPFEIEQNLVDTLLSFYFCKPKYLRKNDIFFIPIEEHTREYVAFKSSSINPQLTKLYFRVNSMKFDGEFTEKPCYIFYEKSTLIQEGTIHEYLPPICKLVVNNCDSSEIHEELEMNCINNCPLALRESLETLKICLLPFIKSDNWMEIKPLFFVKGPSGCGKFYLIQCLAAQMGFNFQNIDCSEIQTLSPSQTEAKLKIALNNALDVVPCILKLSNIHNFGKNSEGKIDNRVTSNFGEQLENIYDQICQKFPLIIIATLEDDEIPIDISRHFIETIKINCLTQAERIDLLEWLLKKHNLKCHIDLSKIASKCSDFVYEDLETLITQAWQAHCISKGHSDINISEEELNEIDFIEAYEYMRSVSIDRIGSLKIPEVRWEDIGGLASLKHEIIRRIEIPLKHNFAIKASGILLYGPPGTGKTLLAKAVATECKLNFLSVKGPELLNMYVGQSEKNIRDIFDRARAASPCIIFFDELDALAPNRGRSGDSGGVMDRVVSQLLAEMDGLDSSSTTFIIGATNRPDLIDPALLRPGRFDKLLYVGVYSEPESQLSVLKAITRKFTMENNDENLDRIVKILPKNLTGADLYSVCSNAWLNAAKRIIEEYESLSTEQSTMKNGNDIKKPEGPVTVLFDDFYMAIQTLVPSVSKDELERYDMLHKELTIKK